MDGRSTSRPRRRGSGWSANSDTSPRRSSARGGLRPRRADALGPAIGRRALVSALRLGGAQRVARRGRGAGGPRRGRAGRPGPTADRRLRTPREQRSRAALGDCHRIPVRGDRRNAAHVARGSRRPVPADRRRHGLARDAPGVRAGRPGSVARRQVSRGRRLGRPAGLWTDRKENPDELGGGVRGAHGAGGAFTHHGPHPGDGKRQVINFASGLPDPAGFPPSLREIAAQSWPRTGGAACSTARRKATGRCASGWPPI